MSGVVEVAGLTKRFGDVVALDSVDMVVERGQIHGLLGPNGAGKSTLLRIILGLVKPNAGTVTIHGRSHERDGTVATLEGVAGFVDRPHFYPYLTARRTLELLAAADGLTDRSLIDEVLTTTQLADVAGRRISGWSTGMRQRLGLACALLRRPRLLLLDEPTEGLDPSGARDLTDLVQTVAANGVTVVVSSHDMAEVDAVCHSATIVRQGRVALQGSLDELRDAAPLGRHRLATSDDARAVAIAEHHPVDIRSSPRGGLSLEAGRHELHGYICDLGRADVSVVSLEQELAPLTALFFDVTGEGVPVGAAP